MIMQLRRELGANEDTEHLIDWLQDAWSTLDMLRERFDETRARQFYMGVVSRPVPPQVSAASGRKRRLLVTR